MNLLQVNFRIILDILDYMLILLVIVSPLAAVISWIVFLVCRHRLNNSFTQTQRKRRLRARTVSLILAILFTVLIVLVCLCFISVPPKRHPIPQTDPSTTEGVSEAYDVP